MHIPDVVVVVAASLFTKQTLGESLPDVVFPRTQKVQCSFHQQTTAGC
jgi:hypothetical protein